MQDLSEQTYRKGNPKGLPFLLAHDESPTWLSCYARRNCLTAVIFDFGEYTPHAEGATSGRQHIRYD